MPNPKEQERWPVENMRGWTRKKNLPPIVCYVGYTINSIFGVIFED